MFYCLILRFFQMVLRDFVSLVVGNISRVDVFTACNVQLPNLIVSAVLG